LALTLPTLYKTQADCIVPIKPSYPHDLSSQRLQ
jgi:hypothetical protein